MSDIWDNKKAKAQKKHAERMRGGAGKGDSPRNVGTEAFSLGMKLLKLKKGTKEYDQTLKAWQAAKQNGR